VHIIVDTVQFCAALLIEKGADLNAKTEGHGYTPLHIAAERDALQVAKFLLDYGADPTLESLDGYTALGFAEYYKTSQEMIKLLSAHTKPRSKGLRKKKGRR